MRHYELWRLMFMEDALTKLYADAAGRTRADRWKAACLDFNAVHPGLHTWFPGFQSSITAPKPRRRLPKKPG